MAGKPDKVQAVIFDVDGVLFDTEMLHIQAWQAALSDYGLNADDGAMKKWIGRPCAEMAEYYTCIINGRAEPEHGERIDSEKAITTQKNGLPPEAEIAGRLYERKEAELRKLLSTKLRTAPGIEEHLKQLSRVLPLAYATTTTREMVDLFFSVCGVGTYFRAGVTLEDVAETKPSPEPYLKALRLLKVPADKAVVLEDSPAGIRAAKRAGCYCLGIASSLTADALTEADMVFSGTAAACEWIEGKYGAGIQ